MNHDTIPDGDTIFAGRVIEDPMEAAALNPVDAERTHRTELPARIKGCIDIVDLIAQDIELKKAGKDWVACCPFHQEKTPSFTVSREKQFGHCFSCGWHGDAYNWLMDYHRLTFPQTLQALGRQAGVRVPRFFKGTDAREAGLSRGLPPRKVAEIEDALADEAHILLQYLTARRAHRGLSTVMRKRMGGPDAPPEMGERELTAVRRMMKAFEVLYAEQ